MARCDEVHAEFDRHANGDVQAGELPSWLHVRGRVVWYVYQGSYSQLGEGFREFMGKASRAFPEKLQGPPGDVYVCPPEEHQGDLERTLTTILWAPLAE
ncbi:MAG: hypothetical protein ACHQ16_08085 [Candidatus Lutacidiplasmatales archaeon]